MEIYSINQTLVPNYDKFQNDSRGGISFLKWAGGKGQLISELEALLPPKFNNYFEPFVGGGSLFFNIKIRNPNKKYFIMDINDELINSYSVVKNNLESLITLLEKHRLNHEKLGNKYYFEIRALDISKLTDTQRAARFIFLNKTCWNGLYRVNSKGKFNVPPGKYKKPRIYDTEKLHLVNSLLKNTKILSSDFSKILDFAKKGDFIYFDPPYYPISETSKFTDYTKNGFNQKDQERLAEIIEEVDKRGCLFLLSNSDSLFIRHLYSKFKIKVIKARRMINCNGNKRGPISELIIRNY